MLSRKEQRGSRGSVKEPGKPSEDVFLESAYLQSIIDTVPDAMIVIDQGGKILSFSRMAERMFGYFASEVIGENISILMPSPDREAHDGYLAHYLETGEKRVIGIGRAVLARRRDGTIFPADLEVGETSVEGRPIFTGFLHDLSESSETRRKLHTLQVELMHVARVSQMGTLATAIAHELNQPLAAINNYVEGAAAMLAEDSPDTEAARQALSFCADEIERAGQIIRRLREFVTSGETAKTLNSLRQIIEESIALALAGNALSSVSVAIQANIIADEVIADRIQIQQVLVNLIRNAIEAMTISKGRVINISTMPADDNMVEVIVADSGSGLDPRIAERLFQPFETTKSHGMGLGLSICHSIIESHGGRIWAEASAFGGTAFHFTLVRNESGTELPE